ncbi:MAG: NifU family protein [Ignavibacteria bacterium]|nr:NifU family protein [Bacteroidota bacterium]MSQ45946.1 NifU family protein [Ignavibacteria bacterium]
MSSPVEIKIHTALQKVRPYLQVDNGDIEFVSIDEFGIVRVRFSGSCLTCPLSSMTLRAGVERALMLECEEVKRVEAVVN